MSVQSRRLPLVMAALLLAAVGRPPLAHAEPAAGWRQQVIYLAMTDRFRNGTTANDELGAPNCHDTRDPQKFHGGDLLGVRQKLDYLHDLGISTIWITPVYKQVGTAAHPHCGYHGYWPDFVDPDDGLIEPRLGTAADLSALIAAAHARRIRFILDMVVNHAGYDARIVSQHADWFHSSDSCAGLGDPVIFCPLAGLPDFKQELEGGAVTSYLLSESTTWIRRFPVDGIRMDTAKHVPDWFFRDFWIPAIRNARSGLFLTAEAFLEDSPSQLKPFIVNEGFDSVFNFPLRRAFVTTFAKGGSVDRVANSVHESISELGLDRTLLLINLLDNHDVPRFVNEPGVGVPEDEIRRRYHLALVALFTLPGIPQLYYGDEVGLYGGPDPDNRRDMPQWAWSTAGRSATHAGEALPDAELTFGHVQKLIGLRTTNSALFQGSYAEMWRQNGDPQPNVYAFFRGDGNNRLLTILNNGDLPSGFVSIPIEGNGGITAADRQALASGTVLEELLHKSAPSALTVTGGQLVLNLPGKSAGIYRPSVAAGRSAVTFRVAADTIFGESLHVSGSTDELGHWDPQTAVHMRPSNCTGTRCTWAVTLRYLPSGQSMTFKFLKRSGPTTIWEGGTNRMVTVPAAATALVDGRAWQP